MRGLILAAGRGSRLGSLTDERPKALVPVAGVPLIAFQIAALDGGGVTELAIVTGYCAAAIGVPGVARYENSRWKSTNMVRSLETARQWLTYGPCIVSYADIIYSADAVRRLVAADADLAIAYDPEWRPLWQRRFGSPAIDAETFRRDPMSGRLLEIGGRVTNADAVEGQYMGLIRMTPIGWSWIEELIGSVSSHVVDRMDVTAVLAALLKAGHHIHTVPIADAWMEIDSVSDVQLCQQMLNAGTLERPAIASNSMWAPGSD